MALLHVTVQPGETLAGVADRLSPDGVTAAQLDTFARRIAAAEGLASSAGAMPVVNDGRILHVDEAWIPVPPPPPPTPPPVVGAPINEVFELASTIDRFQPLRGGLAIAAGVVRPIQARTEVDAYHKTDLGSQNHEVSATFVVGPEASQANSWHALNARMATTGITYYSVETAGTRGQLALLRVVNGVYSTLSTWTTGWAANSTHDVKLRCDGTQITVLVDGVQRMQVNDTATNRPTGTRVGLHCYLDALTHWAWDNFIAGPIGTTVPPVTPPPITPPAPSAGFYTKNGRVGLDGKQFVAVGLNGVATSRSAAAAPGQWWNDTGMGNMNGRSQLFRQQGFNFVRFNDMRDYGQFTFRDYQDGLFDAMDEYIARGVTVMPAYHAVGPGTNPTPAALSANATFQMYWSEIVARYRTNRSVWLNPLNEPIGVAWDQWEALSAYQYNLLRGLGWTGIIVIDLPQWAQGITVGVDRMAAFVAGKTNVVLGFHNYGMGDQTAAVEAAQARGVPFLIGECGETWPGGADRAGMEWSVAQADRLGIGAVAWWGAGNRNDDYVLRQRKGSTFYDVDVPALTNMGTRMFALAAQRPTQPDL